MYKPETIDDYIQSSIKIQNDLVFWTRQLDEKIGNYEPGQFYRDQLFSSSFAVYDYDLASKGGLLSNYSNGNADISIDNIKYQKDTFILWVNNLSILRMYNSLEILIYKSISEVYNDKGFDMNKSKSEMNNIERQIRDFLEENGVKKVKTNNNRHLINYIKLQSPKAKEFLESRIRIDHQENWGDFFDLIATLRHIIVHNAMLVTKDIENHIKSRGKELYLKYFNLISSIDGLKLLSPHPDRFKNFLSLIDELALNLVKFMHGEESLEFDGRFKTIRLNQ